MNNAVERALRKAGVSFRPKKKQIKLCDECHGTGNRSNRFGRSSPCEKCKGSGLVDASNQ